MGHMSRYVYNRAVSEYLFGGEYIEVLPDKGYESVQSKSVLKFGMFKQLTVTRKAYMAA